MFMHIVTQLSGRLMALYTQVLALLKALLYKLVSNLPARFTQVYQNAAKLYLLNLLRVQIGSNTNRFRVSLITAGQLIKAALTNAKASLIQIGLLLLTTVRQIRQHVLTALKQKKDKLVALIKSAPSRIKKNKIVQTLMARLLTQAGLKLQGLAKQLLQRVSQLWKAKP